MIIWIVAVYGGEFEDKYEELFYFSTRENAELFMEKEKKKRSVWKYGLESDKPKFSVYDQLLDQNI